MVFKSESVNLFDCSTAYTPAKKGIQREAKTQVILRNVRDRLLMLDEFEPRTPKQL